MENHYQTLGLPTSASQEEIRRAYRILARRYHPDVNPGQPAAEERFKKIAAAYAVLGDTDSKRKYDQDLERSAQFGSGFNYEAFENAQRRHASARQRYAEAQARAESVRARAGKTPPPPPPPSGRRKTPSTWDFLRSRFGFGNMFRRPKRESSTSRLGTKVSVIEVSVSMRDAIYGVKKTVELAEPERTRKISVTIPAGVRNGSVVHLRSKTPFSEELVIIVRVPAHPYLSIQTRGLVVEVPISLQEAVSGASVTIPTLDDPVSVRVAPGTSSGQEVRVPGKGMLGRDGTRGDLFVRFLIQVPQSPDAVGLKEKIGEIERYYEAPVREKLPTSLV